MILKPVSGVTKALSSTEAWVGDVLPLMTAAIDQVILLEATSEASLLKTALIEDLSERIKMLLDIETKIPCTGGNKLGSQIPTEFILATYLNPRFSSAIHSCFGYTERILSAEMNRIYDELF